jgi:hypothetical protein
MVMDEQTVKLIKGHEAVNITKDIFCERLEKIKMLECICQN